MKKLFAIVLIGVCFFGALSFSFNDEINLFNGKDLNGWIVYGTEKWYVEDGLLISESGPDKLSFLWH